MDASSDIDGNAVGSAKALPGLHLNELKRVLIKFNTKTSVFSL